MTGIAACSHLVTLSRRLLSDDVDAFLHSASSLASLLVMSMSLRLPGHLVLVVERRTGDQVVLG